MELVLTKEELKPSATKIETIATIPNSKNKVKLQRYPRMVTYLAIFNPSMATVTISLSFIDPRC